MGRVYSEWTPLMPPRFSVFTFPGLHRLLATVACSAVLLGALTTPASAEEPSLLIQPVSVEVDDATGVATVRLHVVNDGDEWFEPSPFKVSLALEVSSGVITDVTACPDSAGPYSVAMTASPRGYVAELSRPCGLTGLASGSAVPVDVSIRMLPSDQPPVLSAAVVEPAVSSPAASVAVTGEDVSPLRLSFHSPDPSVSSPRVRLTASYLGVRPLPEALVTVRDASPASDAAASALVDVTSCGEAVTAEPAGDTLIVTVSGSCDGAPLGPGVSVWVEFTVERDPGSVARLVAESPVASAPAEILLPPGAATTTTTVAVSSSPADVVPPPTQPEAPTTSTTEDVPDGNATLLVTLPFLLVGVLMLLVAARPLLRMRASQPKSMFEPVDPSEIADLVAPASDASAGADEDADQPH
mgnify:FL=1